MFLLLCAGRALPSDLFHCSSTQHHSVISALIQSVELPMRHSLTWQGAFSVRCCQRHPLSCCPLAARLLLCLWPFLVPQYGYHLCPHHSKISPVSCQPSLSHPAENSGSQTPFRPRELGRCSGLHTLEGRFGLLWFQGIDPTEHSGLSFHCKPHSQHLGPWAWNRILLLLIHSPIHCDILHEKKKIC